MLCNVLDFCRLAVEGLDKRRCVVIDLGSVRDDMAVYDSHSYALEGV